MKTIRIIATLLAFSLCAGTAMARGTAHNRKPPPDEFKKLDANHDGKLSKEEKKH